MQRPDHRESPVPSRESAGRSSRGQADVGPESDHRGSPEQTAEHKGISRRSSNTERVREHPRRVARRGDAIPLQGIPSAKGQPRTDIGAARARKSAAGDGKRQHH